MTRREIIIELGRTLRDVEGTETNLAGHGGEHDSRILQATLAYRAGSYAALEAALAEMRRRGKHAANLGQRTVNGYPLGVLRWHYRQRYIAAVRRLLEVHPQNPALVRWHDSWQPAQSEHRVPLGGIIADPERQTRLVMVELWDPGVRPERVELALDWLELVMPDRLRLPDWANLGTRAA